MENATHKKHKRPGVSRITPREIKARRIVKGYRLKDLASEASQALKRPIYESAVANVLARRSLGDRPGIHELQKFLAKKLSLAVRDLKPPFDSARWDTR